MLASTNMELPWSSSINADRQFNKILFVLCALLSVLSLAITFAKVPDFVNTEQPQSLQQPVRVILPPKLVPLPPPPASLPVEEPILKSELAPEHKAIAKPTQRAQLQPTEPPDPEAASQRARQTAEASGVMQFQEELGQMRDMVKTSTIEEAPLTTDPHATPDTRIDRALITSTANAGSGGIETTSMRRDTGDSVLSNRETLKVKDGLGNITKKAAQSTKSPTDNGASMARSEEEIRKVMEQHKGAIYSIYNRALRQNAALQGKMVVRITISPLGSVVEVSLVSSDLDDSDLERKILQRIGLINFPAAKVARTTLNQTFDFIPQ